MIVAEILDLSRSQKSTRLQTSEIREKHGNIVSDLENPTRNFQINHCKVKLYPSSIKIIPFLLIRMCVQI
jgi:hypothetical protein